MSKQKRNPELLTNFKALSKLAPLWADNDDVSMVARTFVCEDIIDMDVEEWRDTAVSEHIRQFIDYTEEAIDAYIESIDEEDDRVTYHVSNMKESCLATIQVILKYLEAHEIVRNA